MLEMLLKQIKTGWNLNRTKRIKPTGYCGLNLTIYAKDDLTISADIFARTMDNLKEKLEFHLK